MPTLPLDYGPVRDEAELRTFAHIFGQSLAPTPPIEPKWFRAARRDTGGLLRWLGDYEKQPEAVDAAYAGKEAAVAAGEKASFLVFNAKAELLEQVDS